MRGKTRKQPYTVLHHALRPKSQARKIRSVRPRAPLIRDRPSALPAPRMQLERGMLRGSQRSVVGYGRKTLFYRRKECLDQQHASYDSLAQIYIAIHLRMTIRSKLFAFQEQASERQASFVTACLELLFSSTFDKNLATERGNTFHHDRYCCANRPTSVGRHASPMTVRILTCDAAPVSTSPPLASSRSQQRDDMLASRLDSQ